MSLSGVRLKKGASMGDLAEPVQVQAAAPLAQSDSSGRRHRERIAEQGTAAERTRLRAAHTTNSRRHPGSARIEQTWREQRRLAHVVLIFVAWSNRYGIF